MAELQIQVDSGRQRVPINDSNTGEEVGVFYFSPTDFGIVTRFNESMKDLDKLVAPLEKINIHADGTTDEGDEKAFEIMAVQLPRARLSQGAGRSGRARRGTLWIRQPPYRGHRSVGRVPGQRGCCIKARFLGAGQRTGPVR